jgi:hypothetical protein
MRSEISELKGELLASQVEWMFLFHLVLKKWRKMKDGVFYSITAYGRRFRKFEKSEKQYFIKVTLLVFPNFDFHNSTANWKVSMLRPFVPLVRATCR